MSSVSISDPLVSATPQNTIKQKEQLGGRREIPPKVKNPVHVYSASYVKLWALRKTAREICTRDSHMVGGGAMGVASCRMLTAHL